MNQSVLLTRVAHPTPQFPPHHLRWPQHEADEIEAVAAVLQSGRVNSLVHGDQCRAFEAEFARFCEADFAISVANGTVALELALHALEVGPGDEVIVPARSFFATTSAVVAVGATPVFADIDPDSQNINPGSVRQLVNSRTRAIICVHLNGRPCDMDALDLIAREHGLWLIEDCAQAHGARYRDRPVGSFGDAAAFSFCTDKIMSTGGEGGMLLLKDEDHWARAWAYKDHGKDPAKLHAPAGSVGFRYVHDSFGTNMRLTEMQAAIGRAQLRKLPSWLERRQANAAALRDRLVHHPLLLVPTVPQHVAPAWYKFAFRIDTQQLPAGGVRDCLLAELGRQGFPAAAGSCPDMSGEAAVIARFGVQRDVRPAAALLGRQSMILPVDHLLGPGEMEAMAECLLVALDRVVWRG